MLVIHKLHAPSSEIFFPSDKKMNETMVVIHEKIIEWTQYVLPHRK